MSCKNAFLSTTICINRVCPSNSTYCYGKCSVVYQKEKKPGHLVNLGELVGPETNNLLCMA